MTNISYKNIISPSLFTKKINTNYELIPLNISVNDTGITKYLPPVAKEWRNSVYNYNSNNTINYPIYDLKVNSLIKGYFNMYFKYIYRIKIKTKIIINKIKKIFFYLLILSFSFLQNKIYHFCFDTKKNVNKIIIILVSCELPI